MSKIDSIHGIDLRERHFQTGKIVVLPFTRFCEELKAP
jgi:hypothetical protein